MSEERSEQPRTDRDPSPEPTAFEPAPPPAPPPPFTETPAPVPHTRPSPPWLVGLLALLLIVVIGGVLMSPFWAPAVMPALPWGERAAARKYDTLAARIGSLEQRPVFSPRDVDDLKSAQQALAERVSALETGIGALRQSQGEIDATKTALTRLSQHVDEIAAQLTARSSTGTAQIEKMQQELAQRGTAIAELANRVEAVERQVQVQANVDRGGAVMLLALLQMREAIEVARPFPAEYAAFKQLAAHDPELLAAAEPLADAAHDGVASRAVLRQRLADLAGTIATPVAPPAAKRRWWIEVLDRLRGLVTIRHLEPAAKTGPAAALDLAQTDLSQGDLASAVAAVGKLTGADATTALPWLKMARQRLATETALTRLEELLTARLGAPSAAAPSTTPPAMLPSAAPAQPAATAKPPS